MEFVGCSQTRECVQARAQSKQALCQPVAVARLGPDVGEVKIANDANAPIFSVSEPCPFDDIPLRVS